MMDINEKAILHIIQNDYLLPVTCVTELKSTRNTRHNDSIWTHMFSKCWVILKPPYLPGIIMNNFKSTIFIKIGPIGELKTTSIKQCLKRCHLIEGVHFFGRKWCETMTHISSSRTMFSHGRYYASHPATQLSIAEKIQELSPEIICSCKKPRFKVELVRVVHQGCIKPTTDHGTLELATLEMGKLQDWCMVIIFLSHLENNDALIAIYNIAKRTWTV